MNTPSTQEVPTRVLGFYRNAVRHLGADAHAFFDGTGVPVDGDPATLTWDAVCTLSERLEALAGGPGALEDLGETLFTERDSARQGFAVEELGAIIKSLQLVASPRSLYWAQRWTGPALFPHILHDFDDLPDRRFRVTMTLPEGYRVSESFFRVNVGVFRALPGILGLPSARVELVMRPRGAEFRIEPPPSLTLWSRLRHGLRAVFAADAAIEELASQQVTLKTRYVQLQAAHAEAEAARDEALQSRDAAESALKVKREFLAVISHELLTPMNGIVGNAELLDGTTLDDSQREYLDTLRASARNMHSIVTQLLDFSELERRLLALERTPFDPRAELMEAARPHAHDAAKKGVALTCDVSPEVPAQVTGDARRWRQVLGNLLENAVKFTERGEVFVRVTPGPVVDGELSLAAEVRDTGAGMTRDVQAGLYQPFRTGDGSTNRRHGGTGMGLAVCSQLVHLMGGTIRHESKVGSGSVFRFDVRVTPGTPRVTQPVLAGLRTLVVTDHPMRREALCALLERAAATISAATSADALPLLRDLAARGQCPHAIVVDAQCTDGDPFSIAAVAHREGVATALLLPPGPPPTARLRDIGASWTTFPCVDHDLHALLASARRTTMMPEAHMLSIPPRVPTLKPPPVPTVTVPVPAPEPRIDLTAATDAPRAARRVLVVDDNPVNLKVAARLVERQGYEVDLAVNGCEAVEAISKAHYAVVLLDCMMPEMDGYEATRRVRELEAGGAAKTNIVAVTANAMQGDRERCLDAGMDDYIAKPVTAAAIQGVLAKWTDARRSTLPPRA